MGGAVEEDPIADVKPHRADPRLGGHDVLYLHLGAFAPHLMDIRTRLPAEALKADPHLSVRYSEPPVRLPELPAGKPKVVVLQRPGALPKSRWRKFMAHCIARQWVVVVECDDHPQAIAQIRNAVASPTVWQKITHCHAVQTSTARLAAVFAARNPEVKVFANAVFDLPPFPDEPRPERVFYGAVGRGAFAVGLAASLGPVVRDFPDVEFVVVGDRDVFDALPTANKQYHPYLPYADYLDLMSGCTIALSPLEGREFQDCKSDAKFLDAARGGALTIASPTVYAQTIQDGINGLIAREQADWARLLALALGDPARRREMARRAWEYVRDRRLFADQIAERRDWYLDLWARRNALTARLIERCPDLGGGNDSRP
jgi:glycosyltransferase involved in cell wall biosynthesis